MVLLAKIQFMGVTVMLWQTKLAYMPYRPRVVLVVNEFYCDGWDTWELPNFGFASCECVKNVGFPSPWAMTSWLSVRVLHGRQLDKDSLSPLWSPVLTVAIALCFSYVIARTWFRNNHCRVDNVRRSCSKWTVHLTFQDLFWTTRRLESQLPQPFWIKFIMYSILSGVWLNWSLQFCTVRDLVSISAGILYFMILVLCVQHFYINFIF